MTNLVRVLARQSRTKSAWSSFRGTRGPEASGAARRLSADGFGAAIIDAVFDLDLETIGSLRWTIASRSALPAWSWLAVRWLRGARTPAARRPMPRSWIGRVPGRQLFAGTLVRSPAPRVMPVLHLDRSVLLQARTKPPRAGLGKVG